jgi:HEAT repeat protein
MQQSALDTLLWQAIELYPVARLLQFLDDASPKVRQAAARAIQLKANDSFQIAIDNLRSSSCRSRESGAFILGQMKKADASQKQQASKVLQDLLISDTSSSVRAAAAASLGHLEDSSSIPILCAAAQDISANVRASVAASLSRFIESQEAKRKLKKLQNDNSAKVRYWAFD